MTRTVSTVEKTTSPCLPLVRKQWRLSFGLTALFAAVTTAAVISGAARMPALLGVLFAIDGLVIAIGLFFVQQGYLVFAAIESGPLDRRCAAAQIRFGLMLVAFGVLTFGAAAIASR